MNLVQEDYKSIINLNVKNFYKIPDFIVGGNKKTKAAFIGGFFDAEGNIDIRQVKRKDGRVENI